MESNGEMYRLLADLLEYPDAGYESNARRCLDLASALRPGAAERLAAFVDFVESTPRPRLEESFTAAFDLQPAFCPYVGHHVIGDDSRRSMMMARLQELYRSRGFDWGRELPDHVSVVLRFLSTLEEEAEARDLVDVALAPAFQKMAGTSKDGAAGFALLVQAAAQVLTTS
jgi:nitrate reductase molybdenum cofactor assembly chaperone NarJ/NarW